MGFEALTYVFRHWQRLRGFLSCGNYKMMFALRER
jgi:hypothetical protein